MKSDLPTGGHEPLRLWKARSWLYRRRFLQVNIRLKALDEIYKIYTYASFGTKVHTFAPPWNLNSKSSGKKERPWPKTTRRKDANKKHTFAPLRPQICFLHYFAYSTSSQIFRFFQISLNRETNRIFFTENFIKFCRNCGEITIPGNCRNSIPDNYRNSDSS